MVDYEDGLGAMVTGGPGGPRCDYPQSLGLSTHPRWRQAPAFAAALPPTFLRTAKAAILKQRHLLHLCQETVNQTEPKGQLSLLSFFFMHALNTVRKS